MKLPVRLAAVCILAAHGLSLPAIAATPASGTLSAAAPEFSYSAGPFPLSNTSTDFNNPSCQNPVQPCDDFALVVDLPPDYATAHPRDLISITAKWPVNNDAFYLYLLDASGKILFSSQSANDPNTLSVPAISGSYTVRIVPSNAAGDTVSASIRLVSDQTARAAGVAPRFIQQESPAALGNNTGGEMNIGYNPRTKRAMTLGFLKTLRVTFPENFVQPLPESCDALWEDVSDTLTTQNTNDPILFTDQQTGRTFVSQLIPSVGQSVFAYTDDDGATWNHSPSTIDGGTDHQTVGGGPYSAGGSAKPSGGYANAVYYCSQSVVAAFCVRSDDGGATYGAPAPIKTAADCDGFLGAIHGHARVAPDGTVYVPDRNCGGQHAVMVSEDSGASWAVRRLPATATAGEVDPSIGVASDGTGYFCYVNGDGHPHVAVTRDRGKTWINDRDIGYGQGVVRAVFPQAVAGDPERAACAFVGTTTPGNFQATDFTGVWYAYIAMTYDGGQTWHTVNPTPTDPVQGTGGICVAGSTCIQNRNLLDFNEITLDERGRVLFGFDDGCTADCITTHIPAQSVIPTFVGPDAVAINSVAQSDILRQSGGRSLYSAYDGAEPAQPHAACLSGGRDASTARLNWKLPDNGGAGISGFRIYRGTVKGAETALTQTALVATYDDKTVDTAVAKYYYKITALNARGEGVVSNTVELAAGTALPAPATMLPAGADQPPLASLGADPSNGAAPLTVLLDASASSDPDNGDHVASYTFDFGDGSALVTQAGATISHVYAASGSYTAKVSVVDTHDVASLDQGAAVVQVGAPPPANHAPVAHLASNHSSGTRPLTVHFDASASSDPDSGDHIAVYRYDFGDGSPAVSQAGAVISHTFQAAGRYTVSLSVTDSHGAVSAAPATTVIVVNDITPSSTTAGVEGSGALGPALLLPLLGIGVWRRRRQR